MPSRSRTLSRFQPLGMCLMTVVFLYVTASETFAAFAAGADQNNGYSGKMLARVTELWSPPPALKSDFRVRVMVSVDGKGKVVRCNVVETSGLEAFDSSVCGTVQYIGVFDVPPQSAPLDVNMIFWNGTPKGRPRQKIISQEEALRDEARARAKAEAAINDTRAATAEDRARERAEAIAKAGGTPLPEARARPLTPHAVQQAPQNTMAKKRSPPAGQSTDSAPATQLLSPQEGGTARPLTIVAESTGGTAPMTSAMATGSTPPKQQRTPEKDMDRQEASVTRLASPMPGGRAIKAQGTARSGDLKKYGRTVSVQLRSAILIPVETKPGTYKTRVQLILSSTGEVTDFKVLSSTGDKLLDKYVQRGIRRAGNMPPPPPELGSTLDITLTLVRR